MYTDNIAMVIPAGVKNNAADCFAILDPDSGGAATFSVPLIAIGQTGEATHFGTYTQLTLKTYDALVNMTTNEFKDYINTLKTGKSVAGAAFKNSLQMSAPGQNFWAYIASIGLQRVPAAA